MHQHKPWISFIVLYDIANWKYKYKRQALFTAFTWFHRQVYILPRPYWTPFNKNGSFFMGKEYVEWKDTDFLIERSVECKTTWKLLCSQFQYLFHNPCPSWWNKIPENLKELEIKIRSENLEADVATCVFKFSCHSDNKKRHRNSGFILI